MEHLDWLPTAKPSLPFWGTFRKTPGSLGYCSGAGPHQTVSAQGTVVPFSSRLTWLHWGWWLGGAPFVVAMKMVVDGPELQRPGATGCTRVTDRRLTVHACVGQVWIARLWNRESLGHKSRLLEVPGISLIPNLSPHKCTYSTQGSAGGIWTALAGLDRVGWPRHLPMRHLGTLIAGEARNTFRCPKWGLTPASLQLAPKIFGV